MAANKDNANWNYWQGAGSSSSNPWCPTPTVQSHPQFVPNPFCQFGVNNYVAPRPNPASQPWHGGNYQNLQTPNQRQSVQNWLTSSKHHLPQLLPQSISTFTPQNFRPRPSPLNSGLNQFNFNKFQAQKNLSSKYSGNGSGAKNEKWRTKRIEVQPQRPLPQPQPPPPVKEPDVSEEERELARREFYRASKEAAARDKQLKGPAAAVPVPVRSNVLRTSENGIGVGIVRSFKPKNTISHVGLAPKNAIRHASLATKTPIAKPRPITLKRSITKALENFKIPGFEIIEHLVDPRIMMRSKSEQGVFSKSMKLGISSRFLLDLYKTKSTQVIFRVALMPTRTNQQSVEDLKKVRLTLQDIKFNGKSPMFGVNRGGQHFNVDVTSCLQGTQTSPASVSVKMRPDSKNVKVLYCVSIVKELSHEQLVKKLERRTPIPDSVTKEMVAKTLNLDVNGICLSDTTFPFVRLKCPIGQSRIVTPCRGKSCTHFTCFDALNFIQTYRKSLNGFCPLCDALLDFEDLKIDSYFESILRKVKSDNESNCTIQLTTDGGYSILRTQKPQPVNLAVSLKVKEVNVVEVENEKSVVVTAAAPQNLESYCERVSVKLKRLKSRDIEKYARRPSQVSQIPNGQGRAGRKRKGKDKSEVEVPNSMTSIAKASKKFIFSV